MNWLLHSNILIDYLNGIDAAAEVIGSAEATRISRVSWIEVLVGSEHPDQARKLRSWLTRFDVVEIDEAVAERAIALRKEHRLRLPDALIWASAQQSGLILVTRNTRDFPPDHPGIYVPYQVPAPR